MAVAWHATTAAAFNGATSWSVNHTASGTNRLGVVHIGGAGSGVPAISAATWNSVAMTEIGRHDNASYEQMAALWRTGSTEPPTSSVAVSITYDRTSSGYGAAVTYTGVDQTSFVRTGSLQSAEGTDATPTATVSSATDDLVIDCVHTYDIDANPAGNLMAAGASQTELFDGTSTADNNTAGSYEAGAASVVMSWTISGYNAGNEWDIVACSLQAAGGGGGGTAVKDIICSGFIPFAR